MFSEDIEEDLSELGRFYGRMQTALALREAKKR